MATTLNGRPLGVPPPSEDGITAIGQITVTNVTSSADPQKQGAFVVTYETDIGEESAPSYATNVFDYNNNDSIQIGNIPVSGSSYVVARHVYLAVDGDYYLIDTINNNTSTTTSFQIRDDEIDHILESQNYYPPPDDLRGLVDMGNGVLAGYTNDLDSGVVHMCEPYQPHAWPFEYRFKVRNKIRALAQGTFGMVALTEGKPVLFVGSTPDVVTDEPLALHQAIVNPRAVTGVGGLVVYASPDGLVAVSGEGAKLLTDGVYTREQWRALFDLDNIQLNAYENHVFIYDGTTTRLFSLARGDIQRYTAIVPTASLYDEVDDALYYVEGDYLRQFNAGLNDQTFTWRGAELPVVGANPLNSIRVDADAYPITIGYDADGKSASKVVTSRKPARIDSTGRKRKVTLSVSGDSRVSRLQVAGSIGELG